VRPAVESWLYILSTKLGNASCFTSLYRELLSVAQKLNRQPAMTLLELPVKVALGLFQS